MKLNESASTEMLKSELIETDGGLIPLIVLGISLIGATLEYRDEIAQGLVEGYMSVRK